jgi:predicted CoA-binding protein
MLAAMRPRGFPLEGALARTLRRPVHPASLERVFAGAASVGRGARGSTPNKNAGAKYALGAPPKEARQLPINRALAATLPTAAGITPRLMSSDALGDDLPALEYADSFLKEVLNDVRTIAMVGASSNWNRPSYFAMKYMQAKGYRVVPINPGSAGKIILGEHTYKDLEEMDAAGIKVDMVDVFQRSDRVGPIADAAVAIGAKVLWMQLGVRNDKAAASAQAAGLKVVQDRCPKIEFR